MSINKPLCMDLTTVLATALVTLGLGLVLGLFAMRYAKHRIEASIPAVLDELFTDFLSDSTENALKTRLEVYISAYASSYIQTFLGDVGTNPAKYAPIVKGLVDELAKTFMADAKGEAGSGIGGIGGDMVERMIPKKWRGLYALYKAFSGSKTSTGQPASGGGSFG
jgi:hypothetical protein